MNEQPPREESDQAGDEARDQARSWVVRLASGRLTVGEAEALRRWHAADPAHAKAFAEAKAHWRLLGAAAQEFARDATVRLSLIHI